MMTTVVNREVQSSWWLGMGLFSFPINIIYIRTVDFLRLAEGAFVNRGFSCGIGFRKQEMKKG